ncbi:LegC family aminotransferase [Idiomarina xiamenensis]|uniref:Aminotransferase n=1 Tax=Idiomarina xiamenensis 10-D-4 TaxID=740709 RepID=K2JZG0_9GAMM|nr:LegC family aminotransferase [Idiomarina xiamenensis]EKE80843.1 aminotransferase [Idiomarina xiamenensis 10-D-4]
MAFLKQLTDHIRAHYGVSDDSVIPLHAPQFGSQERSAVLDTIDSTFVSSVGRYVDFFERQLADHCQRPAAVATVNGTAALHTALLIAGVEAGDLVLTQALTFVATCNAIRYCQADPVFIDVERESLGMSATALAEWLAEQALIDDHGICRQRESGRPIRACVPMHTYGHPCDMDALQSVCQQWRILLLEDAAEALGSSYRGRPCGGLAPLAAFSFNGNKVITCGGGGMVLGDTEQMRQAKHLTTTAKQPHAYEFVHDQVAYNYRLPNLNAALGHAQMRHLPRFLADKRATAEAYQQLLSDSPYQFIAEPSYGKSNYWLNTVLCRDLSARDALLSGCQQAGIQARPVWRPMHQLAMYQQQAHGDLSQTEWLAQRLVNLPSSVRAGVATDDD